MLIKIDNHSGVPIYRQIIAQVRAQVLTGRLVNGKQVLSVRELAARLKVNPMTVSKAYSQLEGEGLLERRRGTGLFVKRLSARQRDRGSRPIIEDMLKNAAVAAVQLGIPRQQATELFKKYYRQFRDKNGGDDES